MNHARFADWVTIWIVHLPERTETGGSQLVWQVCTVHSSNCTSLGWKVQNNNSQNIVAITLPANGCVLNFFGQALPTDDSELHSLAHNNEPKSHLQSPDANENHVLT